MTRNGLTIASIAALVGLWFVMAGSKMAETPGQHFRKAIKEIAAQCARRTLAPGEVCGEVAKLPPADPLATPEGRFAHAIKIPNPVPEDSGYKPDMTPEQYFDHLCKTEAGEFIYKTVENVEGIYQMRPRERVYDSYMQHLYALEDPFGYRDWEAEGTEKFFVRPSRYSFFEKASPRNANGQKMPTYKRYLGSRHDINRDIITDMVVEDVATLKSRYGFTWRGITRTHDRELGIAGGELIVLDLQTDEVLGVRRGFARTGNVRNLTGIWWLGGQVCPKDGARLFAPYEFVSKVLKPTPRTSRTQGGSNATK